MNTLVRTTHVKIRRSRVLPNTFVVTETYSGGSVTQTTYTASNLREAIAAVLDSKDPGYELDIKLTV